MARTRLGYAPDDLRNSHGAQRHHRGKMVKPGGEPRSHNRDTKKAPTYWERNGKKTGLPRDMTRGWK